MKETDKDFTIKYNHNTNAVSVEFEIYEIVAHSQGDTDEFDVPFYEKKDAKGSEDMTQNIEEAQTFIRGIVKWDGCSHFYFGDNEGYIHLCGKFEIEKIAQVIKKVYEKCGELMGDEVLEGEFINKS